jgi:hypothetical protein
MSLAAIRWARRTRCGSSSCKSVLWALADADNDEPRTSASGKSWPPHHTWVSLAYLCEATELDRKTVITALARLIAGGLIEPVGTDGRTNQIRVFRLRVDGSQLDHTSSAEIGISTENGTVPDSTLNSAGIPKKASRISLETIPKAEHGTRKEEKKEEKRELRSTAGQKAKVEAPTAATESAYATGFFERYGVRPVIAAKQRGQLAQVVKTIGAEEAPQVARYFVTVDKRYYVERCHDLGILVSDITTLRTQWAQGAGRAAVCRAGSHTGFGGKDYRIGVEADGTIS